MVDRSLIDVVAEVMANGWDYGTHPKEKARIVLEAIRQHTTPDRVAEELRGIIPGLLAWDPSLEGSESFLRLKALALSSGGAAATEQLDDFISGVTLSSDNLHALLEGRKVVIPLALMGEGIKRLTLTATERDSGNGGSE